MSANAKPAAGAARGQRASRRAAWLVSAGLLLLAGCGPGRGDVTGEVTYKGQPLSLGRITFIGQSGKQEARSAYIIKGKYTLTGFPAGPAKVTVESIEPPTAERLKMNEARAKMYPQAAEIPEELKELASGPKLPYVKISTKYSSPETSGLTFEVKRGTNTYDIPLTE
jgi:hypothetical protein